MAPVSDPPPALSLPALLARQATALPEARVLVAPGQVPLTYGRLWTHVQETLQGLRTLGVGRQDRVAVVLPAGAELAVALLAVATGATCAPLNPAYRAQEYEFYLSDLGAKALIVQSGVDSPARTVARAQGLSLIELTPVPGAEAGLFTLHGDSAWGAAQKAAQPEEVALVLHTSGTTARPKLVPLTHANLCTSAYTIARTLALQGGDCCLNIMPLFHIHGLVGALLSSLAAGGSVVCPSGFHPVEFFTWLGEYQPTWYTAVPTMHQAILARAQANHDIILRCPLRFIRSSSAALPPQVMMELEKIFQAPVIESYGMTEAAHQITSNPLPPQGRKPGSVGVAAESQVAIMDDAGRLLPPGESGEVVIRGINVTRGYDHNPAANTTAFTHGWFRTGDQGYLDVDGYLFLTGRLKELINRGGEKIFPREVDEVLMDHPAVAQAVTFAVPHATLGEEVAAAVVLRGHARVTAKELRAFAAMRLADFKVPRQVVFLEEIPRGPTGKLQRIGLAEKFGLTTSELPTARSVFRDPRTPLEARLTEIWSQVLRVHPVGIDDNFFQLGGDSILATQILSRVRAALQVEVSFLVFFETPTISGMAHSIESAGRVTQTPPALPLQPLPSDQAFSLSSSQQRLWFLDQLDSGNPAYNRPVALRLTGPLNVAALEQSVNEIVRRHAVFRTIFPSADGRPVQIITPLLTLTLSMIDLYSCREDARGAEVQRLLVAESQRCFDLAKDPLLRGMLLRLSEVEHILLLVTHHIVFDGWSMGILVRELTVLYEAFCSGKPSPLPELAVQYADCVQWQQQWLQGPGVEAQLAFWRQRLRGTLPVVALPADRPRPAVQTFHGTRHSLLLSKTLSVALKVLSQREEVTLFMTLLAAFQTLLHCYTGQDDIVVGSPVAGRNRVEMEGLIGVFINPLVLRTDLSGNPSFREVLQRVREVALSAYTHQDLPFEKLVEALRPERDLSRTPLFQVMLQLRNLPSTAAEGQGLRMEEYAFDRGVAMLDMAVEVSDRSDGLWCVFEYNTDLFKPDTITRMSGHYQILLEGIVTNPDERIATFAGVAGVITKARASDPVQPTPALVPVPRQAYRRSMFSPDDPPISKTKEQQS